MLTAKQEAFAQAVADGMTQSDAYRKAYDAAKMKPETINNKAHVLIKEGEIKARVASLRKALESKGLWTREKSVVALAAIADGSEAKPTEIVAAIKELNLMHGFNAPTKLDIGGTLVHRVELVAMRGNKAN